MINLPLSPMKTFFVDDDDEFIKEATRRRNYSEPCWCGSNLLYKKCHRVRSSQKRATLGQLLKDQQDVFWKVRACMHPNASTSSCSGKIIDAHTIQRKGPLASIVDASNHVYRIEIDHAKSAMNIEPIGWRKASIFPGFCAHHDNVLFHDLEKEPFSGTKKQCLLQSYRNVCNELYKKRALVDSLEFQRSVVDCGLDLNTQIEIQLSIFRNIQGQNKSIEELKVVQEKYHRAILSECWDDFEYKIYPFKGSLDLVSAAIIQIDYDFDGNKFVDLFNLSEDAESIAYTILSTENGGAIVFCWPKEFVNTSKFVESFSRISDDEKGDIFAQYCFLSSEHTFFSKMWADKLTNKQKKRIYELYQCTFYEGGKFVVGDEPLVNWKFF